VRQSGFIFRYRIRNVRDYNHALALKPKSKPPAKAAMYMSVSWTHRVDFQNWRCIRDQRALHDATAGATHVP